MKFVVTYTTRPGGSVTENVAAGESAQKLLANWTPSSKATIKEWVQRCDANGGFCVLETEDAGEMLRDFGTWSAWLDFQIFPVLDIIEATPISNDALSAAKAVV